MNMDGWAETYYKTEEDYINGTNKVLPYVVNCESHERVGILSKALRNAGFTYAPTMSGIPSQMTTFLVNMSFKKYTKCPYPVHYASVNDRVYTLEEFMEEVFNKTENEHE